MISKFQIGDKLVWKYDNSAIATVTKIDDKVVYVEFDRSNPFDHYGPGDGGYYDTCFELFIPKKEKKMKTKVAIVRDHSASMRGLGARAMDDYNLMLEGVKSSAVDNNQDTDLSVVECGVGAMGTVKVALQEQPVYLVHNITSYQTSGGSTPLFDSVGQAITSARGNGVEEADTAYLVMVITDGYENSSRTWNARTIAAKINELQVTDKWTFAFRVPVGQKSVLERMGIPSGNILEWEQTEASLVQSTTQTVSGISNYFSARSKGKTSARTFYADTASISSVAVARTLTEVTKDFTELFVSSQFNGTYIKAFFETQGYVYQLGRSFYQLTKPETVQDYKTICVREKNTGKIYTGQDARSLLGLPLVGTIKLAPGLSAGKYDLFVQSNSVNRKLVPNTVLLHNGPLHHLNKKQVFVS